MASKDAVGPDLKTAIRADQDCLPCKIVGFTAFSGLGVFVYFSGHHEIKQNAGEIIKKHGVASFKARRFGITGTAAALVGLGMYRLLAD